MEPQIHFVRAYHRSACKRHRDSALRNSVSCARHRLSPPSTVLILADERRCAPHSEFRAEQVRRTLPPCRSEEHTSELQSLMRTSYAVFCLKKKTQSIFHLHITIY